MKESEKSSGIFFKVDDYVINHYIRKEEKPLNKSPKYWTNHGYVYSLGDGIIVVYGLYSVTAGEMVLFSRANIIGML